MIKRKYIYFFSKLVRNSNLFYKLAEFRNNNFDPSKWIFIIGCYNSGTTLLNKILLEHKDIVGLPDEGAMLTNKILTPEDFNNPRMIIKNNSILEKQFNVDGDKLSNLIKKHWSFWVQSSSKKVLFLEKSIINISNIEFFNNKFKPAYFIFIRRNGYAVASGICRKTVKELSRINKPPYQIEDCIKQWLYCQEKIENAKKLVNNYIEITYEDLVNNAWDVLNKISIFLEISKFDKDILETSWNVHEKNSKIVDMNINSINYLSNEDINTINIIASSFLKKYGYYIEQ